MNRLTALTLGGILLASLAGCSPSASPQASEQGAAASHHVIKFALPAHKTMPACEVLLQVPKDTAVPDAPDVHMALVNIAYLAVRSCPEAQETLKDRAVVEVPLAIKAGTAALSQTPGDPISQKIEPLPKGAQECVQKAIETQKSPKTLSGLDAQLSVFVKLPEKS